MPKHNQPIKLQFHLLYTDHNLGSDVCALGTINFSYYSTGFLVVVSSHLFVLTCLFVFFSCLNCLSIRVQVVINQCSLHLI